MEVDRFEWNGTRFGVSPCYWLTAFVAMGPDFVRLGVTL